MIMALNKMKKFITQVTKLDSYISKLIVKKNIRIFLKILYVINDIWFKKNAYILYLK